MIHPASELRFVSPMVGYGLIATAKIPKGTITWVRDGLDQIISPRQLGTMPALLKANTLRYSYLTGTGRASVLSVVPLADGRRIVSTGRHNLEIWEITTQKILGRLEGHTGVTTSVSLARDQIHAVSGPYD